MNLLTVHKHYQATYSRVLLVLGLACALLLPQVTAAYFSDTEISGGERFQATELLLLPVTDPGTVVTNPTTDGTFNNTFLFTNDSTAAQYDVAVTDVSGNQALCDNLALQATSTEAAVGEQPLASFSSAATTLMGPWSFTASMDSAPISLSAGSVCNATFTVTGWQANMTKAAPGYTDTTTFQVQFTYETVVPAPASAPFALGAKTQISDVPDTNTPPKTDEQNKDSKEKEPAAPTPSDEPQGDQPAEEEGDVVTPTDDDIDPAPTDPTEDDAPNPDPTDGSSEDEQEPNTAEEALPVGSKEEEKQDDPVSEDTENAPVPDPEPVDKRQEEEQPADNAEPDEPVTEKPDEINDDGAPTPTTDETDTEDTDSNTPDGEGSTPESDIEVDESGSTPNDDNS